LSCKATRAEFCKLKQTNVENIMHTFKEEHKLQVFDNRKIFGHKKDEVSGEQRILHDKNSVIYKVRQ
jgi:hypothetical protein